MDERHTWKVRETARLFVALWPTDTVRDALAHAQDAWAWPPGARRTQAQRLHLTLHFIGSVELDRLGELAGALRVPFMPFELMLTRCELWKGGIAVMCPAHVPAELLELHAGLSRALAASGLPVEGRPFRPHVTFARRAAGARLAMAPQPVRWHAREGYRLVRTLPGAGYEPVAGFI